MNANNSARQSVPGPERLLAELTHRCPLRCPYCSNPLALVARDEELDAVTWARVFREAAALGVRQIHLTGGEPGARRDLADIVAHAREAGPATRLITSGFGITTLTLRDLWEAGLDHVQVSMQDADAVSADRIAGRRGAFQRKHALAAEAVRIGLPLTIELVVHRANIARIGNMVALAHGLKARHIEIVPVQYRGWAARNRAALMPTEKQARNAADEIAELRSRYGGEIEIAAAGFDFGGCGMAGNDGRLRSVYVTPSGRVLSSDSAEAMPGLEFWNVQEHSLAAIWTDSPAFKSLDRQTQLPSADTGSPDLAAHRTSDRSLSAVQADADYAYRRMG